jgi:hypothetical protein
MPAPDELQADRKTVRRKAAGHRKGRMAGQVEGEGVGIPGAADRAGIAPGDLDPAERIEPDRQGRRRQVGEAMRSKREQISWICEKQARAGELGLVQIDGAVGFARPRSWRAASGRAFRATAWHGRRDGPAAASAAAPGNAAPARRDRARSARRSMPSASACFIAATTRLSTSGSSGCRSAAGSRCAGARPRPATRRGRGFVWP